MSRLPQSRIGWMRGLVALAACGWLVACESDKPANTTDTGTTGGTTACSSNGDCAASEVCVAGLCEPGCTSDSDCGGGTCDVVTGLCQAGTGGGTGGSGGSTGGGTGASCTTKYDCDATSVCKNGTCQAPSATNACNSDTDCARGKICNFSRQCEAGCTEQRDCPSGQLCHPQKFLCEVCSQSNPCPSGQTCVSGACTAPKTCTTTKGCVDQGLDGYVCKGGVCANCGTLADCNVDPYKGALNGTTPTPGRTCSTAGLCVVPRCDNTQCQQQLGPRGYCDATTGQCSQYECLTDADCGTPRVCDTAQKKCSNAASNCSGTALQQCDSTCQQQGLQCNPATCNCGGGASGSGQDGDGCAVATDCASGLTCFSGLCAPAAVSADGSGAACDALTCVLGGLAGGGCVSGVDPSVACDPIGCLSGLLGGGLGGGGGGGGGSGSSSCTQDADCPGGFCESDFLSQILGGGGTCKGGSGASCTDSAECAAGEACAGGGDPLGLSGGRCTTDGGGSSAAGAPCL